MSTYNVAARRWEHGWELHVGGIGVTQSATLVDAEQTVRNFLATWFDRDECTDEITIVPELGGLEVEARHAAEHTARAAEVQREAAAEARSVARRLRSAGLSVADAATVLGVSRGRVSQLTKA
ncbi:MAG: hypothetical protein BGO26_02525 [Actinobacteria bacterium 69-20]|nr:antitoxin HicB [Actinomycetota bacterium]OJV31329.1 MAG: hypothetical protein BGO26_02525 [Actinobacteria bacterium 69-20]